MAIEILWEMAGTGETSIQFLSDCLGFQVGICTPKQLDAPGTERWFFGAVLKYVEIAKYWAE